MATTELKNFFLSASIPLPERDTKYFETADIIAIRDAVIALATVILPTHKLVWGGHPSITPLIYYVMEKLELNVQEHITLYQSKFFEKYFPADNNKFNNVIQTENMSDRKLSLLTMRSAMLNSYQYTAGIFIGGMEGVEEEYAGFKALHPNALTIPVASTGAAAKIIFDNSENKNERLLKDYAYMSLFQDLLL